MDRTRRNQLFEAVEKLGMHVQSGRAQSWERDTFDAQSKLAVLAYLELIAEKLDSIDIEISNVKDAVENAQR